MSLIIRIIIINYFVLMLDTIYNKSNAVVKKTLRLNQKIDLEILTNTTNL